MARNAGISARISGDPRPLKQAQDTALVDTQAWVNKMVGLNSSIQKSYSRLAFSGPAIRSPIQSLADQDARAWAQRMRDTERHSQAWGKSLKGGTGMAILQTAQAADDLQYGLRGVLNNIPSLVMALGGKAGLAGALALIAVLIFNLHPLTRIWKQWFRVDDIKRAKDELEKFNQRLKEAVDLSAKDAMNGTAEGAEALAAAVERANEEYSEQQRQIAATAARQKELIQAQAALDEAKVSGSETDKAKQQRTIQIEEAKALHRETIAAAKAEMDAHFQKAKALDDYAKKQEAVAAEARAKSDGLDPGSDQFIKDTVTNKAAAAERDAANARAVADKAHNDSLREQKRIAEEIAHAEKVFAKELETQWIRVDERVAEAERRAGEKRAADRKAEQDAKAEAEEKEAKEEERKKATRKRQLEDAIEDAERQIRERDKAAAREAETGEDGDDRNARSRERGKRRSRVRDEGERSRRIDARAKKPGRGFGVDDVHRYQSGSLRGKLDNYIGQVGNRKPTYSTDRQAHEAQIKQKNQDGDPLLNALTAMKKELEKISTNTEGLQKSKSEPLQRQ